MVYFLKSLPALICWGIFAYVILKVPYPDTLTSANAFQIFSFFTSLFLAFSFTLNIFLNFMLRSIIVSFGLILLVSLKSLNSLNIVSFGLTIIAFGLLLSYLKKPKRLTPIKSGLTSRPNVPKLKNLRRQKH